MRKTRPSNARRWSHPCRFTLPRPPITAAPGRKLLRRLASGQEREGYDPIADAKSKAFFGLLMVRGALDAGGLSLEAEPHVERLIHLLQRVRPDLVLTSD